jgi:hypothetical protein
MNPSGNYALELTRCTPVSRVAHVTKNANPLVSMPIHKSGEQGFEEKEIRFINHLIKKTGRVNLSKLLSPHF